MHGTISSIWRTNACVSGGIYTNFIGQQVFKPKLRMTRILYGPASLLAADPLNVCEAHNLLNWLRKTHARGGHWGGRLGSSEFIKNFETEKGFC
jgi:hypothetical protein